MPRKKRIFLSHSAQDREAALALSRWMEELFAPHAEVFSASDWASVQPGTQWYDAICRALKDCALGLLLVTPNSLSSHWVYYEVGALRNKKTIPICSGGVLKSTLPSPINQLQACDYDNAQDRLSLLRSVAQTLGWPAKLINAEMAQQGPELEIAVAQRGAKSRAPTGLLGRVFPAKDRWTTIIYTCRAQFSGETCLSEGPVPSIGKTVLLHVPVDELHTVCAVVQSVLSSESREHEDDIADTMMCAKQAANQSRLRTIDDTVASAGHGILDRDWIIIGENNLSRALLRMMQAYLPWQFVVQFASSQYGEPSAKPEVFLELVRHGGQVIRAEQKKHVGRGGGMLVVIPNPYNMHRRILILFGCHRLGQFALEHWLRSDDAAEVLSALDERMATQDPAGGAIQVVVDRSAPAADEDSARRAEVRAVRNRGEEEQPYWSVALHDRVDDDPFKVNSRCEKSQTLFDLSLVISLDQVDQGALLESVSKVLPNSDLYDERKECNLGLHVTLYEFCTHEVPGPAVMDSADAATAELLSAMQDAPSRLPRTIVRVRQLEIVSGGVIAYVDFVDQAGEPTAWLYDVRAWCEGAAIRARGSGVLKSSGVLNRMRIPFPLHVTLRRFNVPIEMGLQKELRSAVRRARYCEFARIHVGSLTLARARRSPYRDVEIVGGFGLSGGAS